MISVLFKTLAALAVAAFMTTPAIGGPKPIAHEAAACALGAQVMAEQARRGVNIFDAEQRYPADYFKKRSRIERWPLTEAQQALLDKHQPESLFVRCPELMKQLPAGARMATPEDRIKVEQLGLHRLYIGTILAPLVAPDGRSALMFESTRCVGLCGGGSLHVYRRVDGAWIKGEPIFTLVS